MQPLLRCEYLRIQREVPIVMAPLRLISLQSMLEGLEQRLIARGSSPLAESWIWQTEMLEVHLLAASLLKPHEILEENISQAHIKSKETKTIRKRRYHMSGLDANIIAGSLWFV